MAYQQQICRYCGQPYIGYCFCIRREYSTSSDEGTFDEIFYFGNSCEPVQPVQRRVKKSKLSKNKRNSRLKRQKVSFHDGIATTKLDEPSNILAIESDTPIATDLQIECWQADPTSGIAPETNCTLQQTTDSDEISITFTGGVFDEVTADPELIGATPGVISDNTPFLTINTKDDIDIWVTTDTTLKCPKRRQNYCELGNIHITKFNIPLLPPPGSGLLRIDQNELIIYSTEKKKQINALQMTGDFDRYIIKFPIVAPIVNYDIFRIILRIERLKEATTENYITYVHSTGVEENQKIDFNKGDNWIFIHTEFNTTDDYLLPIIPLFIGAYPIKMDTRSIILELDFESFLDSIVRELYIEYNNNELTCVNKKMCLLPDKSKPTATTPQPLPLIPQFFQIVEYSEMEFEDTEHLNPKTWYLSTGNRNTINFVNNLTFKGSYTPPIPDFDIFDYTNIEDKTKYYNWKAGQSVSGEFVNSADILGFYFYFRLTDLTSPSDLFDVTINVQFKDTRDNIVWDHSIILKDATVPNPVFFQ